MKWIIFFLLSFLFLGCVNQPQEVNLIAVGDIASCTSEGDSKVAKVMEKFPEAVIATLGDTVYEKGTSEEFEECFDPVFGSFNNQIRPAVGNHEYKTARAQPYFDYFGNQAGKIDEGYYSYDIQDWHIIVLNTNCENVDCSENSVQAQWLKQDLEAHQQYACTLAYFHHPLVDVGTVHEGGEKRVKPLFQLLYDHKVDVVLNGHDHVYARLSPINPDGEIDIENGIRTFIVGTGGREYGSFRKDFPYIEAKNSQTWGVLGFKLKKDYYEWEFFPEDGKSFRDQGIYRCK